MPKGLFIFAILFFVGASFSKDVASIKLEDVNGKMYVLKDHLANDANIILFWATWCLPCQREFPEIQKIVEKYPDKKISVIAISKDSPRSVAKVKSFVRKNDYNFIWLLDSDGAVCSNFMVDAIPHSFVADSTGRITYEHTGYRKGDERQLEKELLRLWEK